MFDFYGYHYWLNNFYYLPPFDLKKLHILISDSWKEQSLQLIILKSNHGQYLISLYGNIWLLVCIE